MNRMVVNSKVGSDGILRLDLPLGADQANREVQVTVESVQAAAVAAKPILRACDLLNSGLVGMWAGRTDVDDSREFARRLREQAQTQRRDS